MYKNLKITITLLLSLFILSCSNDDGPKKEYYPTKITTAFTSSSSSNGTMNISYDNKNRIAQFKYENATQTNTFDVTYNSDKLVSKIVRIKSNGTASVTFTANYSYTNKILSNINLVSSSTNENIPVTYQASTNSYTLVNSLLDTTIFKFDSNENLILYGVNGSNISFNYNNNNGIFNLSKNSTPLLYASLVSEFNETLNYSWFFSTKEITQLMLGSKGSIVTEVIRDENNNITQISQKDGFTNEIYSTSSIDYILR
jgi:hypothetical protein